MTEENIWGCLGALGKYLGALGSFGHHLIEAECVWKCKAQAAGIFGDVINALLTRECIRLMHLPSYQKYLHT